MSTASSEERAVAKLALDMLKQGEIGAAIASYALGGDDAGITLPAIVVSAVYQEIEWALKKSGHYGGRYRLDVELRGIRTNPGTEELDAMLKKISNALNSMPSPLPESAARFAYFLIEKWESVDNQDDQEVRDYTRSYTVFVLFD